MAPFQVQINGNVSDALQKVQAAIQSKGGTFTGDQNAGSFSGTTPFGPITGQYTVSGNVATIDISDKPLFLPESLVISTITGFFNS